MPPTLKQTVQAYRIYLSSLKLQAVNCSIPGACLVLHSETRFLATAGQGGAAGQGSRVVADRAAVASAASLCPFSPDPSKSLPGIYIKPV